MTGIPKEQSHSVVWDGHVFDEDADGRIPWAVPNGASKIYSAEFELPYPEKRLTITAQSF